MNSDINSLIQTVVDTEKKGLVEKIDAIKYTSDGYNSRKHTYGIEVVDYDELMDIILSSQIDVRDIDVEKIKHDECEMCEDSNCENCNVSISIPETKTKGDVIRESNESLAEYLTDTAIGNGFIGDRTQLYNIYINYLNDIKEV